MGESERDPLDKRVKELENMFELRYHADQRAVARWRAFTGRHYVLPDHADLVVWLLGRLEEAEAKAENPIQGLYTEQEREENVRLRCLEIAARTFDQDYSIGAVDLIGVAETLRHYAVAGIIPQALQPTSYRPKDEVSVVTVTGSGATAEISVEGVDPRMGLTLKDMALPNKDAPGAVNIIERRHHPEQGDDE